MIFRKKKQEGRSSRPTLYKKQQSYHYSAKRSNADKLYGRSETNEDAAQTRKQDKKFGVGMLPSIAALVLIVFGGIYLVHLSSSVQLESVSSSTFVGDKAAVQKTADEYMNSSLLNRTKLTFNEEKLQKKLAEAYPGFHSITVKSYPFRQKATVSIQFSEPSVRLSTGANVYILSEDGTVLIDASRSKPSFDTSSLPLIQDQTDLAYEVGKPALTAAQVAYIRQIAFQAQQKGLTVDTMTLVPGGGELNVRYGGLPYFVKYNFFEDARKSSGTFLAMKEELERSGVKPAEYIDVRIPERAYVK